MSGGLRLYIDFLSQPSRALYIILKQSKTPFELVQVALRKGEQLKNEFKNINRLKTVPCIVEDDLKLAESIAILRYLAATNRISEKLYPSDVIKRARIDEFLEWQHSLRRDETNFFLLSWLFPIITGKPTPAAKIQEAKEAMEKTFDIVENTWLGSSKFVAGNGLSIADILGVCEVQQTKLLRYDLGAKYPKMVEWVENVQQQTNPDFDEAHKVLITLSKKNPKGTTSAK